MAHFPTMLNYKIKHAIDTESIPTILQFIYQGNFLAIGSESTVTVLETETGVAVSKLTAEGNILCLQSSKVENAMYCGYQGGLFLKLTISGKVLVADGFTAFKCALVAIAAHHSDCLLALGGRDDAESDDIVQIWRRKDQHSKNTLHKQC
ncbi:hypothetical protein D9615_010685 [Tricholomella constricta]|uniref:Uncharacterized protein n=1 Tax=Tricholomella constricta TaxID=117010 RepID=A0A8H5GM27_9AGAR|nr:hypothetical protein D9615_010685 [Tricholomella constricta]